ncbi:MAG: pyrroloquinoline quinone biosynthesis protein PqqB [Rhodospirillales bacterium]|nr:MAG: pyrroloquinoline quinone biosynthesis protein PqqB [Rhodospirillales bacterium]
MRMIVLGAAAGGGFPQWNCNCSNCRRAREGDPAALPRTQSSLAVTADGKRWLLLNASPDLRQQLHATRALHPRDSLRHSPLAAVLVTNGDVDHIGGLLDLREGQPLSLYASARVHALLDGNRVFDVLDRDVVARRMLALDRTVEIADAAGEPIGLGVQAFAVPGKVALYMEEQGAALAGEAGDTVAVRLIDQARGSEAFYVPNCAHIDATLAQRLDRASVVFFDGTLFRDDEMLQAGLGAKTGRRMGHVSMSGPDGAIAGFEGLDVGRKIFVHVNNSNPALLSDSAERREVEAAGWEIAYDGMEVEA